MVGDAKSHCKDVGYGTSEDYVHVFNPPQRLQNIFLKLINENCIEGSNKTGSPLHGVVYAE